MKTKRSRKSIEITVETDELILARGSTPSANTVCPVCHREVQMITPEAAARIAGVSTRTIYGWLESGKVHFSETAEGLLFICLESLVSFRAGPGE